MLPNVDVPNAGAAGAAAAGLLPKELDPNAGAVVAPAALAQGDGLAPRIDVPPNAGAGAEGDPKAGGLLAEDANADGAESDGAGVVSAVAAASPVAMPGYVVPPRIDSLYTIHQATRTPSLLSTQNPGRGPGEYSISSVGIGLYTFSLLDKSSVTPTG